MTSPPTERTHPDAPGLHARPVADVLGLALAAQMGAVERLRGALDALIPAAEAAARVMVAGGRVVYAGAVR
ncbi:MAG: hypothetical protein Q4G36_03845 [Paracoccus sp. (in: a-proteobacteria)]|nr:hypothetical protein [Paracoccus sp. (in: a-proteobacteria)]